MNWKNLFNERRSNKVYNVRLPVTWTDRIMEFIALTLLLAMWVVAAVLCRELEGHEIPTHWNLSGVVDKQSDPISLLVIATAWTFVMLLTGFSAYRPRLLNPPTAITTVKQLKLLVTQTRVMNIILGIMGIFILLAMVNDAPIMVLIPALLLFIEVLVFSILIRRAGK
ncbi:MAG: hypothetical protein J6U14_10795 [Bacteroidaceae bacterium]|nr:hypothetical protein [Bacteroidaceae bacterium]